MQKISFINDFYTIRTLDNSFHLNFARITQPFDSTEDSLNPQVYENVNLKILYDGEIKFNGLYKEVEPAPVSAGNDYTYIIGKDSLDSNRNKYFNPEDGLPHTLTVELTLSSRVENSTYFMENEAISITIFLIPKNFMINHLGTNLDSLKLFRAADWEPFINKEGPDFWVKNTSDNRDDRFSLVRDGDYMVLGLPDDWNSAFSSDGINFKKIYDEFYFEFSKEFIAEGFAAEAEAGFMELEYAGFYNLYLWVYRTIPDQIVYQGQTTDIDFIHLMSSANYIDPGSGKPSNAVGYVERPPAVNTSRFGYVMYVVNDQEILIDGNNGSMDILSNNPGEKTASYRVKFNRWDDNWSAWHSAFESKEETFNIVTQEVEDLGLFYHKFGSKFRLPSNFILESVIVKDDSGTEIEVDVSNDSDGIYISIPDIMIDKTSKIEGFNSDSEPISLTLFIYQDVQQSILLRYDFIDIRNVNIDNETYSEGVSDNQLIINQEDDLKIMLSKRISAGKNISRSIKISRKEGSSDIEKTSPKSYLETDSRIITITYKFMNKGIEHFKQISVTVNLVFDYTIIEPFLIRYFETFNYKLRDWGETGVMKREVKEEKDGYYVHHNDLSENQLASIKKYLGDKIEPDDYFNEKIEMVLEAAEEDSLYDFMKTPSNGEIAKKEEPPVEYAVDGKSYKERVFRFDGERFLYYIDITIEIVPLCFESINDVLIYLPNLTTFTPELTADCDQDDTFVQSIKNIEGLKSRIQNIDSRGVFRRQYKTKIEKNGLTFEKSQSFKLYVYNDIEIERLELGLCEDISDNDVIIYDENLKIFDKWESEQSTSITLDYSDRLLVETSRVTDTIQKIITANPGLGVDSSYTITVNYNVIEKEDSPFQDVWPSNRNRILHITSDVANFPNVKVINYLKSFFEPDSEFSLVSDSVVRKEGGIFEVTLEYWPMGYESNCEECTSKCQTKRYLQVLKYDPFKTLVLCKPDLTFNSDLLDHVETYYSNDGEGQAEEEYESRLDIDNDGDVDNDDWLIVRNKTESGEKSSQVGIFKKSINTIDHLWKTTKVTFKSNDNFESPIVYYITVISNIRQCKVVTLGRNIKNKIPDILKQFLLEQSDMAPQLKLAFHDIDSGDDDESYELKSQEIDLINNKTESENENVNNIRELLTMDSTKAKNLITDKKDFKEIDFTYNLFYGDRKVTLNYNLTILYNRLAKYIRLPPVIIGEEYNYTFDESILAEDVSICNIYCLPEGLKLLDDRRTISGTVKCHESVKSCSDGECSSNCPVKIMLELSQDNKKGETTCDCADETGVGCIDDCTYYVNKTEQCKFYDVQPYFLNIISEPKALPLLKVVNDSDELEGTILTIEVEAGSEDINLYQYVDTRELYNKDDIKFEAGLYMVDDNSISIPKGNSEKDIDQIIISAKVKNDNCGMKEFGKIIIKILHPNYPGESKVSIDRVVLEGAPIVNWLQTIGLSAISINATGTIESTAVGDITTSAQLSENNAS